MDADHLLRALSQLAGATTRLATLEHLAVPLGAEALFVFVPHPDVPGRLIPAPGCACTVPSGRGWRDLLARCGESGTHAGQVAFPSGELDAPAIAYAYPRITIVAVGHARPDHTFADALSKLAPLLAALLDAEQQVVVTHGELDVAREATDRASTLANALERARQEAVRAMRAKDEFLAMLGHELRNPLAPILTAVHMLRLEASRPASTTSSSGSSAICSGSSTICSTYRASRAARSSSAASTSRSRASSRARSRSRLRCSSRSAISW